jgi:hypothetical protein
MRLISIAAAIVLFLFGGWWIVQLIRGFWMLHEMLVDGVPCYFGQPGRQWHCSGRLVGTVVSLIPIVCALVGVWLLKFGLRASSARST